MSVDGAQPAAPPPIGHPRRLDLVRHGQSAGNIADDHAREARLEMLDLATRDMDVPLSELGEAQAAALGTWLAQESPDRIVTSPYRRAIDTAAIALDAGGLSVPVVCDERLREREFGILDRLTRVGIEARHPEQSAARTFLGKMYHRPPGGESWVDVAARVRDLYRDLRLDHPGEHIVVVAHQAVILLFRYVLEDLTEERILAIDAEADIANTAVSTFKGDGRSKPVLVDFNRSDHLPDELETRRPDVPVAPAMIPPIEDLLAAHPLPPADGDKSERGVAVVVAGSEECPGAARLAATAALRAGAGKVQVVTHPTLTAALGVAVPETLVVAWDPEAPPDERVKELSARADAVLVGPGLMPGATAIALAVADHVEVGTPLLLDARSLGAATDLGRHRLVLLPNLGEAEELVGAAENPGEVADLASRLATRFEAVVAVRDATTVVGEGDNQWVSAAHEGLGTGGSGDVLSGVAVGLMARGVAPIAAVGWAVAAHATAGHLAARSLAAPGYGYVAWELVDAIPAAITALQRSGGAAPA